MYFLSVADNLPIERVPLAENASVTALYKRHPVLVSHSRSIIVTLISIDEREIIDTRSSVVASNRGSRRCNVNCNCERRSTLHLRDSSLCACHRVTVPDRSIVLLHSFLATHLHTWRTLEPKPRDCIGQGREICMLQRRLISGWASISFNWICGKFSVTSIVYSKEQEMFQEEGRDIFFYKFSCTDIYENCFPFSVLPIFCYG